MALVNDTGILLYLIFKRDTEMKNFPAIYFAGLNRSFGW